MDWKKFHSWIQFDIPQTIIYRAINYLDLNFPGKNNDIECDIFR